MFNEIKSVVHGSITSGEKKPLPIDNPWHIVYLTA
jgi:hypothetical protein